MISKFDFIDSCNVKYKIIFNEPNITITPENENGWVYRMGDDFKPLLEFLIDNDVGNFNVDVRNFLIRILRNMVFV